MVGELYDYVVAMVITGIIAVSAIVVVPNIAYVNLLSVSQQQLRNIALDTLKTMLLDAGYPRDWGSRQDFSNSTVERFGLALARSSSFYVLDPDKVSRLVLDNPAGHLGYDTIRDKLKLQGYGFNLRIIAPFNVTVNDGRPVELATMRSGVQVVVTYNDGSPIPKATVAAKLLYTKAKDVTQFYWSTPLRNTTDALGRCTIRNADPDFQSADILDFILTLTVTVAGVASISATYMSGFHQQTASASIVGDTVTLWIPEDAIPSEQPRGVRRIMSVVAVTESGAYTIYTGGNSPDDSMTWGEGYSYWVRLFEGLSYEEPLFLIFSIRVSVGKEGGLCLVLFLALRPNWMGARVQAFGDARGFGGASSAVRVQRDVVISGASYVAELTLWKESP